LCRPPGFEKNLNLLNPLNLFQRGVYTPIAIIVSPSGLFGKWEEEKKKEVGAYIFRGAYTTIAINVSPCGL